MFNESDIPHIDDLVTFEIWDSYYNNDWDTNVLKETWRSYLLQA